MNANSSLTTHNWLQSAVKELQAADIPTAKLDALVLLEDCLGISRANILAHTDDGLTAAQLAKLDKQIQRRKKHEPLAYIRGKTEFYGREFMVNQYTLEPRPETETMIELLQQLKPSIIVDVGTGSGAIAVTAKKLFPSKEVIAIDIDPKCLEVARKNAQKHNVTLTLKHADLLEGSALIEGTTILANLPYVPDDFSINPAAKYEPKIAIFGGADGLDLYRKMFKQIQKSDKKPSYILTESLPFQHKKLAEIAKSFGYKQTAQEDFIQMFVPID